MKKQLTTLVATLATATALLASGCGKQLPQGSQARALTSPQAASAKVPSSFMWGVSTAGYQYEGFDTTSQWAAWDKAGKTVERNLMGANGLNDYAADMKLTKDMGCNTFRTSIEWGRIEPKEGVIDLEAVAHYHRMLATMKANGLTPIVTLHHFSHPQWLAEKGGWENREAADHFGRYAAFIAREFGAEIETYLTFNEPNVHLAGGWLAGAMPPGKKNPIAAYKAMKNMIRGHKLAYKALHQYDNDAKVSFNWYTAEWSLRSVMDASVETQEEKAVKSDTFFLDMVVKPDADGGKSIDYVAFDYYTKLSSNEMLNLPRCDRWRVYPEGMYNALKRFHKRYNMPILIAENGMATWEGAPREDKWTRAAYIVAHVREMQRAMAEGVPVLGYVQWSITDNYEWGTFGPRFGLFRVECRNQDFKRIPTDGVDALKAVITNGGVTPMLLARYLPGMPGAIVLPVPKVNGDKDDDGQVGSIGW